MTSAIAQRLRHLHSFVNRRVVHHQVERRGARQRSARGSSEHCGRDAASQELTKVGASRTATAANQRAVRQDAAAARANRNDDRVVVAARRRIDAGSTTHWSAARRVAVGAQQSMPIAAGLVDEKQLSHVAHVHTANNLARTRIT